MFSAHCPHCKSVEFRGVGLRNAIESALAWLVSPYRCSLCGKHFFLLRWVSPVGGTA
jgi:transposase-like protein